MTDKLKILCLHGYRQNAQTFREKTGAFRKIPFVKKNAELVFITAPNRVPPLQDDSNTDDTSAEDQDQRGWWFSRSREYYKAVDYSDSDLGFDESMEVVKQTFKEQGPFDGVLAFSQGASLLSILCAKREQDPGGQFQFNFAVFIAGFKSRQSPHKCNYDTTISIPTLHVIGETDRIIVKEMSQELLQLYTNAKVIEHPGGHFIPATGPPKQEFTSFFNDMFEAKKSNNT